MKVQRLRFAAAEAAFEPAVAIDSLLGAALDMDMSRVGVATAMAYRTIIQREIAPMSDRKDA